MMHWLKKRGAALLCAAALLTTSACAPGKPGPEGPDVPPQTESERFDAYADQLFVDNLAQSDTLTLHMLLQDPSAYGISLEPTLGDYTYEGMLEYEKQVHEDLAALEAFDYGQLGEDQKQTYDILRHIYELELRSEGMALFVTYAGRNDGMVTSIPQILADYRIENEKDVEDYLGLLADYPRVMEEVLAQEQRRADAGMFMSEMALDDVLKFGREFFAAPEESFMLASFEERLDALGDLDAQKKQDYLDRNRQLWLEQDVPAGLALLDGLEALRDKCSEALGLASHEGGKEYYTYLINATTGMDNTMEEITKMVDDSLDKTFWEMVILFQKHPDAVDAASKFGEGPFDKGGPEDILNWVKEVSADEYPPLGDVSYQVKIIPESLQEVSAPAYYLQPPIDEPAKNFIYINPKFKSQVEGEYLVETLAHEGYPGHLYQRNYYNSLNPARIRSLYSFKGYTEGWADYCDSQIYRWLGYDRNAERALQSMGRLSTLLTARADIGVHYEGWDKKQVKGYLGEWGYGDDSIVDEVYKMVLEDPGNALPYLIGEMQFTKMRKTAEDQLGDKFVAAEFHKVILDCGPAPFAMVQERVDAYISSLTGETGADTSSEPDESSRSMVEIPSAAGQDKAA